jgi:pimeloyl-ACP methyl ester carboxylesterase
MVAEVMARLEGLAVIEAWDDFPYTFFRDIIGVPLVELDAVRGSALWPPIVADAKASLGDLRAIARLRFDAEDYRELPMPVQLQIGSESPRDMYVTDALAAVLPDAQIQVLPGQAHEGMTTAPELYVEATLGFLGDSRPAEELSTVAS